MSSHRTSATSAAVPAAGTEGPAAEEPEEAMPIMAAIERDRQMKLKNRGSHQWPAKVNRAPHLS